MKRIFVTVITLFTALISTSQIPIKLINGLPYLEVKLNGKGPFVFGFDTGFGAAMELDSAMAVEIGIAATGSTEIGDPTGRTITMLTGTVAKSELGSYSFSNKEVIFRAGRIHQSAAAGAVGILGMPFFSGYTFTIDYPALQFNLSKSELPAPDKKTILGYTAVGGAVPEIEIQVGNETIKAIVDTRSTNGVFKLPEPLVKKMNVIGEPRLIGRGRTVTSEIPIYAAKLKEPIRMGAFVYTEPDITYPSFIDNQAVIGARILKDYAISIDQKNYRIQLDKKTAASTASTTNPDAGKLQEYTGTYGDRQITFSEGALFVQRQPNGMPLKMVPKAADEFGLERVPEAILKFERNADKKIIALKVFNPQKDGWETVPRNNS